MTNTTGREVVLKGLRQYEEELLDELHQVQESIVKFGGTVQEGRKTKPLDTHDDLTTSDLGPQPVVEKYLRDHAGKFFLPGIIAKRILEGGFRPRSPKNWRIQVRNCLKRSVQKGIAEVREDIPGKKKYGFKQKADTGPNKDDQATSIG